MRLVIFLLVTCAFLSGCIMTVNGSTPKKVDYEAAARSYFELGVAYMQKKRYDLAEPKLLRSIQLKPSAEAYNALALSYEERHSNLLAEEAYKTLIKQYPSYARGYWNYGIFLCKYQRDSQLNTLVSMMLQKDKNLAALGQMTAGNCALERKHYRQARRFYEKALRYNQYLAVALLPLAKMDIKQGLLDRAKEKVDTIHNHIGYSPESLELAIVLANKMQQFGVARKMEVALVKQFPNALQAKKLLGKQ